MRRPPRESRVDPPRERPTSDLATMLLSHPESDQPDRRLLYDPDKPGVENPGRWLEANDGAFVYLDVMR